MKKYNTEEEFNDLLHALNEREPKEYIELAVQTANINPQNEQDWIALDWEYSVLRNEPEYKKLCKEILTKLQTHKWLS